MVLIFDIETIPEEGLGVSLEESPEAFDLERDEVSIESPIRVEGTLRRLGEEVFFRGRLATRLALPCGRCLTRFSTLVEEELTVNFLPSSRSLSEEEVELSSEDLDISFYQGGLIELGGAVRDQLGLAVPMKPLCREDCKGLCPTCGAELNERACGCREEEVDPRLQVLAKLKGQEKREGPC